jgi:monoamine oxidase
VACVKWSAAGVEVETGQKVRAQAAILTLPIGVLRSGAVRFEPSLPDWKRQAVAALRKHAAVKILCRFRHAVGHPRLRVIAGDDEAPVFWRAFEPAAVWTAFVTGPRAATLARRPERAAARLCSLLGGEASGALDAVDVADWGEDPWSCGGYSVAPAGAMPARATLAERVETLVFAGEATSTVGEVGTVSDAILTGERAALEVRELLGSAEAAR